MKLTKAKEVRHWAQQQKRHVYVASYDPLALTDPRFDLCDLHRKASGTLEDVCFG